MTLLTGPIAQLGAVWILLLVVLAVIMGWLVPRRVAQSLVDQANTNANHHRAAAEASEQRADLAVRQSTEMLAALREVESLVRSVESLVRALDQRKVAP